MTNMKPTDHCQSEYVLGIEVGRRIERQHKAAIDIGAIVVALIVGALIAHLF